MTGTVPRVLPTRPRGFVNRAEEIDALRAAVEGFRAAGEQGVLVWTGLPGVGKTALAAQCAHQVKDLFGDGWLCATLGASAEALTVEEALTIFLTQLGVERLPPTRQGLWLAFQEETADRELLMVLDDVESAAQLKNLLPASSRSMVLATSRRNSEGFVMERFDVVNLRPFAPDSSVELLSATIRRDEEEAAIRDLAELCGHLPLALRIAGAHLSGRHRGPVANYVRRLRADDSMVEKLTVEGMPIVEQIFEVSYQELPEREKRAYRLLSLHPGTRFGVPAAAALLDLDHEETVALLENLVVANLLIPLGEDRYEFHVLLRQHAHGLANHHEHPADCQEAVARVVKWYLEFAVARELVLSDRARFGEYFDGRVAPAYTGEDGSLRAVEDLERERPNLRRAVRVAADALLDDLAWQLCEGLFTYYFQRDLSADAIAAFTAGLESARRGGNPRAELRMLSLLGTAYFSAEDNEAALRHFEEAAALAERMPDDDEAALVARSSMHEWKSFVYQRLGDWQEAVDSNERARAAAVDPRFPEGTRARVLALISMNGAPMLAKAGRYEEAIAAGRAGVAFFADGPEVSNRAKSKANLGIALLEAENFDEAVPLLREAIGSMAELGMEQWEADTGEKLGYALADLGRTDEARSLLERAAELYAKRKPEKAEELRRWLDTH